MKSDAHPPTSGDLDRVQLAALIEASKLLNATLDRDEVLRRLMVLAAQGADAERATLYLLDESRGELRSIVALGEELREICLPLNAPGAGLAGYVARTGETVNVAKAYADPRFSRRVDAETGYHTRSVLAVPMRDAQGQISGVIQVLNKRQGLFSAEDERYLLALAEHAEEALENTRLHAALTTEYERLSFLYRVSNLMTGGDSPVEIRLRDVLLTVMEGAAEILESMASSILLWDRRRQRLAFLTATGEKKQELMEIEVPLEGSIAGWVIQNDQPTVVDDVQNDPRFFAGADAHTGFVTRTLLCVPMKVRGETIGALQVLNKRGDVPFDEADLQLAQAVANHAALAIQSARHYESLLRVGEYQERRASAGFPDPLTLLRG